MFKAITFSVMVWCLLLTHLPKAHASWQHVNPGQAIPINALYASNNSLDQITPVDTYICRAPFAGGVHPGWTSPSTLTCAFGWGGLERQVNSYDVWVDDWEPASNGNVPANAIEAGSEPNPLPYPALSLLKPRYVCQARDPDGGWAPGKVAPDIGGCDFPWGGAEQHATSYNVLVDSGLANIDAAGGDKISVTALSPTWGTSVGNYVFDIPPPTDAPLRVFVPGGFEAYGGPWLYICSAHYEGGMQIGKTRPGFGGCDISYGGREIPGLNPFYSMTANWIYQEDGAGYVPVAQPQGNGNYLSSIIGGQEADGTTLYVCLADVKVNPPISLPGRVRSGLGGCSIGYQGQEIVTPYYYVLGEIYTTPISVH